MGYVLAIDGGGTKTQVWCATTDGEIVGEAKTGPASLVVASPEAARREVALAISEATRHIPPATVMDSIFMGLAGVDIPQEIQKAEEIFTPLFTQFQPQRLSIVNDVEIALASGTQAPNAIALIAGTGSNCFGHNANGDTAKVSGYDYLLSDQGSGYALGAATLKAVIKSYDGRLPETVLTQLVCKHYQVSTPPELKLKVYHPALTKPQIAELAKVAEEALNQNDAVAQHLFDELVAELAEMVETVARRLQMSDEHIECVVVGGMMRVPYVLEKLPQKVSKTLQNISFIKPDKPPVYGALQLALKS